MKKDCPSVNAILIANNIVLSPCVYPLGHHGNCADDHGNYWIRIAEHIRKAKEDDHEVRLPGLSADD